MPDVEPKRKLTLAAVAREAGVSAPTVSKVINGRDDVAEETRSKVMGVLARTGYKSPLQQRRNLTGRQVVEVVFDSLNTAYAIEVLNGILESAGESEIEVLLNVTGKQGTSRLSAEQRAARIIDEGRCGMIVVTSAFSGAQLGAFRRRGVPAVVIDPFNPPPAEVVSVGATNWAGGKEATSHLLELGHRRIAYLGGPDGVECNQARLHGYLAAMRANGVTVDSRYIIQGSFSSEHGVEGLKTLLRLQQRPTAIFAANDSIALGVLAEARRQGVRVPEDLSLVGFDGTSQAEESVPALTSVAQPLQEMGRAALRFILSQTRGELLDSPRVELATHLVIRESTAPVQAVP
ncbi:LacI family DNA-binding transcriptional regulator [Arthrobacter rhizosphaerae]|uniref:LacI family DNA-binding transcriptional regulator n=1 Tax=Arthrobacter rhizosphaerae TaxID=2855490 RepID=UPI001FF4897C|nr:substrate-binding domain-containing protein [Arthrobacter rhizosphaerae]